MKRILIPLAFLAALVLATSAYAGCWATVGISPLPKPGLKAGEPWLVNVKVLQHGRTPLADANPAVRIRLNGRLVVFKARPTKRVGVYRARVVFPAAGTWQIRVYDGFVVRECARIHSFGTVTILPELT
jgi:hypothetical protein